MKLSGSNFLIGYKIMVTGYQINSGKEYRRDFSVIDVEPKTKKENEIIFLSNRKTKEKTHALVNRKIIYIGDDNNPSLAENCDWIIAA